MKIKLSELKQIIREECGNKHEHSHVYGSGGRAEMARAYLMQIAKNAQSLHDRLIDDDELPEWVQSKVAVIADNMDSVSDFLEHKMSSHESDDGSL